jgi:hypothetical protein
MTTKAIPCRVCGLATDLNPETFYGHTPSGQRDPASDFTVGTCSECLTLDTVAPGSAVRACLQLLGKDGADWPMFATMLQDMEIDAAAVMFEATGHPRRGPQSKAFAHVPKEVRAELRRAWAGVLEAKVAATLPQPEPTPEPPPTGLACLACGVATAVQWHGPLHTFGLTRGPERVDGYVCPECSVALEQVGAVGMDFLERAFQKHTGIAWSPRNIRPWIAVDLPPQTVPFGWMKDVEEPPLTLDPVTFLMEQVGDLQTEVASLRSEVGALRRVPVP